MLRIFLTGDNHIGMKYNSHKAAETLSQKRIDAFGPMVQKANEEACDLFVIAGDLFNEAKRISKKVIREVLTHLSEFHGTVIVLPGNHDYYDDDIAVWKDFQDEMRRYDNIMLLTSYEPIPIHIGDQEVVLYPAFCTEKHSGPGQNNLEWIKKETIYPDSIYRIGIAHGAIEGVTINKKEIYFQMSPDELNGIPVDVWLIGHTHVSYPRDLTETYQDAGKIFNAGSHVQNDVNTNTEGLCFIIEIADDKKVRAKKFVSGNLRFYRLPVSVTAGNMQEELKRTVSDFGDSSVMELEISGAVAKEEYQNRSSIINSILSRFTEASYNDNELTRLITKDLIDSEFLETGIASKLLNSLLDNPREAQLAYDELKKMKEVAK